MDKGKGDTREGKRAFGSPYQEGLSPISSALIPNAYDVVKCRHSKIIKLVEETVEFQLRLHASSARPPRSAASQLASHRHPSPPPTKACAAPKGKKERATKEKKTLKGAEKSGQRKKKKRCFSKSRTKLPPLTRSLRSKKQRPQFFKSFKKDDPSCPQFYFCQKNISLRRGADKYS